MMDDTTLLALCVWSEAAAETLAGKQAVARVILNRMARHYASDGTVAGTVLAAGQFSGFWYSFRGGKYTRVCWNREDAQHHAEAMLLQAQHQGIWDVCIDVAADALAGTLPDAPGLAQAVLYLNPAILSRLPLWASADKQVDVVGHHTFYRDA